ncbi:DUF4136 domain-containing protein [Elizabethkingia miricola]|uniref:DUF4136 domain-containing protein n=1 Tax=Elizabethkingia miricola TaxID=172045 RepID=UPI002ACE8F76|nr:DUF4136 domain-containing protein [Elizabethkingia miricola]WQM39448.1 DUF4136 domain-containing protein [Elizabethkingia miricola]
MKFIRFLPLLLSLFFIASCSAVNVATDYDKTVDFTKYKTYNYWETDTAKDELSDLDKKRVFSAIDEQMILKGYSKNDNPDFLINLVTDSKEIQNVNTYYGGYSFRRNWGWGIGGSNQTVSTSTEGILYIDILDAKKNELIWQGKGTGLLADSMEEKDKRAKMFVSQILKKFPSKVVPLK